MCFFTNTVLLAMKHYKMIYVVYRLVKIKHIIVLYVNQNVSGGQNLC